MANTPNKEAKEPASETPAPEVLTPREQDSSEAADTATSTVSSAVGRQMRRRRYHPSHKATFVGVAVVIAVLAINAAVIAFVLRGQSGSNARVGDDQVTISQEALSNLGVNRTTVNELGVELVVGPNARFDKKVQVAGDVSVGGKLTLNNTFSATDAKFATLQAGDTALEELNVNGNGTISALNIRNDLTVAGTTRLQGPTTIGKLLTAEGSMNVAGNLTVGGSLAVNTFHASTLVVDRTVTFGGHIITRGSAPGVGRGPAAGNNGTVSISGNDTAGTVAVNAGTGAGNGIVASVSFRSQYTSIPHVVVTPIGDVGSFYIFRSSVGFSIGVSDAISPGGYAFDYIVVQ